MIISRLVRGFILITRDFVVGYCGAMRALMRYTLAGDFHWYFRQFYANDKKPVDEFRIAVENLIKERFI